MVQREKPKAKIVIYRSYFERLLKFPKPLRAQLIMELPTLEAFRTGEITTFEVEHVDFERGDLRVLDSKKLLFYPVPLDTTVALHLAEYIQATGLRSGAIIRGQKRTGLGLTVGQIEREWRTWCEAAGVPIMSPRMGRAYWACYEHYVLRKPIGYIQYILRHDDLQSTEHYLYDQIVSYEDQKGIFFQGKDSPFGSECARSESCPVSCPDCQCRFFQPRIELEQRVSS